MSRGRANGKGIDSFLQDKCGKEESGNNQDDELDGSAAPRNTLETAETMVPVEADFDLDGD